MFYGGFMVLEDLKGLYIAHRGIQNDDTIENTIPAFSLAVSKKIPIEFDIHILKDGKLVVFHDDTLKRLIGIDKKIEDYTYEELKKITFLNTNIHIPLLEEVLNIVDGRVLLVIEIKRSKIMNYREYCLKIIEVLKKYSYSFVVKSFDVRIVNWFLHHTNYMTGLLIANRKKSIYDRLMRSRFLLSTIKPHFLSVDFNLLDCRTIKEYRLDNPVMAWTIRSYEVLDCVKNKADSYLIEKFYF